MHHKTMFYFHTWIHMDGEQGSDIMHISFVDIISYQGICENIICRAYIWSATVVAGRCAKVSFPVRGPARRLQRLFVITWPTMPFIRGTIWKCCRYHLSCSIEHWLMSGDLRGYYLSCVHFGLRRSLLGGLQRYHFLSGDLREGCRDYLS